MQIITSHANTDFDAFASMLAAQKLYPEAKIIFSGTKERALERFLENPYYEFAEVHLRDVNPAEIERIILVDVCHKGRIGPLAQHIEEHHPEVVIIDHHDPAASDIEADTAVFRNTGAATTILVDMLKEKEIPISKIEATIFALGIYEDTGFLTYATTTPEDARQIAYLLECGADLSLISKFLKSELTRPQIDLLNELIADARIHRIHGVRIAIATASRDDYFPDAAAVVHKQMEVERYDAYVAIIRMGERIHLIGRSRHSRVDLGALFKHLGGGGHKPAAYATIAGRTIVEVSEEVLRLLRETIPPAVTAQDIMTSNLLTLDAGSAITEAHEAMVRANVNSIPVTEKNRVVGLVTRQQLGKALAHQITGELRDVMIPEFILISPTDSIDIAEHHIMEGTQRAVLVGKDPSNVEGIITRMDLFRRLYLERLEEDFSVDMHHGSKRSRRVDLVEMLNKRVTGQFREVLEEASRVAEERDEKVFLVGGIVRDLILDFENKDIDLVIIGDGIEFAKALSKRCGGYAHPHEQFGTAVVVLPDDTHVDIVTARRESYAYPGALPDVESGSIRADLYRRDFTINTLAIDLTQKNFGHLIDFFGGMRDIQNRTIRILHGLSFIDDPTRMLRAVRFAVRLNFKLSEGTQQMLQSAVKNNMLQRVSGKRIQNELMQLLENPRPIAGLELLSQLGILENIHRKITLDRFTMELLQKIGDSLSWFRIEFPDDLIQRHLLYYMALMEKLTAAERRVLAKRLDIQARERKPLIEYKKQAKRAIQLFRKAPAPKASAITELLDRFSLESILYTHAFAFDPRLKAEIAEYLTEYRHVKPAVDGNDLVEMGLPQGPSYSSILKRIRRAVIDGKVNTRQEQLELTRRLVKQQMKKLDRQTDEHQRSTSR